MHSNHNNEPLHSMQDLAQHRVEARLQREADKVLLDQIASLSSQVATLTEAMGKKDEALRELLDDNSDDNYCESTCACVGHESDCEFSEEQCRTKWRNLVIAHALSLTLTPASVTQQAEEARLPSIDDITGIMPKDCKTAYEQEREDEVHARIGRAVEKWANKAKVWGEDAAPSVKASLRGVLFELDSIIAKAKEGERNA